MGTQSTNLGQTALYPSINQNAEVVLSTSVPFYGPEVVAGTESLAQTWVGSTAKRVFDLVAASVGVILLLPILAAIALLVRLTSPGPILFRQERVGKDQKPFTIYKYRTMRSEAEEEAQGCSVTRNGDPRFTTIGPHLRKFKLDELPQLFNVIRGDMSLVGPRPKLQEHERMKMTCKPGITGAATIVFAHEQALLTTMPEESFEQFTIDVLNEIKAKIDTEYAQTCTFRTDIQLIIATVAGSKHRKPVTSVSELLKTYGPVPARTVRTSPPARKWLN